ncbi:MAG TPA: hypothetical protein VJG64_02665 [Candidatus Paceibacterota bacterium]
MATTKDRVNVSFSKATHEALTRIAKRDQKPLASKVEQIVEEALELEEDRMLSAIADERLKGKVRWIKDSDEVWK